jgi:hypothetical protein
MIQLQPGTRREPHFGQELFRLIEIGAVPPMGRAESEDFGRNQRGRRRRQTTRVDLGNQCGAVDHTVDRLPDPGIVERFFTQVDAEVGGGHGGHHRDSPGLNLFVVSDVARRDRSHDVETLVVEQFGELFENRHELDGDLVEIWFSRPVVLPTLENNRSLNRAHPPPIWSGADGVGGVEVPWHDRHRFEAGEKKRRRSIGCDLDRSVIAGEQRHTLDLVELVSEQSTLPRTLYRGDHIFGRQARAIVKPHPVANVDPPGRLVRGRPSVREPGFDRLPRFESNQALVDRRQNEVGDGIRMFVGIQRHQLVGIGHPEALNGRRWSAGGDRQSRHHPERISNYLPRH